MGSLIDRDELIARMDKMVINDHAARAAIRIISSAPAIKAYPERTAQIERRMYGKESTSYICTACENAIPNHVIPDTIRYCWKCGARITGVRYATK